MTALADLIEPLRRGDLSLQDGVDQAIASLSRLEPRFLTLVPEAGREDRLRREAGELARRFPSMDSRPPLFGALVGVKDIFHVDGIPTRAGSDLPPDVLAGPQAESVRRLQAAGALVLGKTVTTEFAYFAPGPTRNPRNPAHTPGGSSSGSAAAVAAGLAPLALGTQTIGSIVRPASFCGVVGVKPTYRRIPTEGVIPLAPSLDHVGFFTPDAASAALAASLLCDRWHGLPEVSAPTLGVPEGPYLDRAGQIARRHFEQALATLAEAGFSIRRLEAFGDFELIAARHQRILAAEAAAVHRDWYDAFGDRYHERTAGLIRQGREIDQAGLREALDGQAAVRRQLHTAMDDAGIDLWAAPSTVGPAPAGLESTGDPVMNLPWTQAGLPALTLPCGLEPDGLPLGLQLVARWYDDERLLAWAQLAEMGLSLRLPAPLGALPSSRSGVE